MPNPIGTKEQREELRRRMHGGASFVVSPSGQHLALDGLDIAEEAMRAQAVLEARRAVLWGGSAAAEEWFHWRGVARAAMRDALAEWYNWQAK